MEKTLQCTKFMISLWFNLIDFRRRSRYRCTIAIKKKPPYHKRNITRWPFSSRVPLFKLLFLSKGLGGMEDDVWLRRSNEFWRVMELFSFIWARAGLLHLSCLSFSSLLALARSYTNITLHVMRHLALSCDNPAWYNRTFCGIQGVSNF